MALCCQVALNLVCGRSFNDLAQYPVLPWVIADYDSETLDLSDPQVIRLIAAEGLNRRPPAGACRLFLGTGFRLAAR